MADRRNAADRKTRHFAHEVGVGAPDRLADQSRDPFLVDTVRARGDYEHGPAALRAKDQRLRDLRDRAADCSRGVLGGSGAGVELEDFKALAERSLNLQGRWGASGLHIADP